VLYAFGATLWLVVPAMLIGGGGIALFDVWWTTALAERIPADKLSRVSSYDWMVSLALLPLGYVLAGPLASALGSVDVLIGGSVLAAVALALGLLPRETRMLERFAVRGDDAQRTGRPRASHTSGAP
jgi:MFS family permease